MLDVYINIYMKKRSWNFRTTKIVIDFPLAWINYKAALISCDIPVGCSDHDIADCAADSFQVNQLNYQTTVEVVI